MAGSAKLYSVLPSDEAVIDRIADLDIEQNSLNRRVQDVARKELALWRPLVALRKRQSLARQRRQIPIVELSHIASNVTSFWASAQ